MPNDAASGKTRNGNTFTTEMLQYPDDLGQTDKGHMVVFFINVPEASKILKSTGASSTNNVTGDARFTSNVTDQGMKNAAAGNAGVAGGVSGAASGGSVASGIVNAKSAKAQVKGGFLTRMWSATTETVKQAAIVAGGQVAGAAIGAAGGAAVGYAGASVAEGLLGTKKGYKQLKTAIALYMPQEFSTSYNASYSSMDTGALTNLISDTTNAGGGFGDIAGNTLKRAASSAASKAMSAVTQSPYLKTRGLAENPNSEQIFERINHREFSFTFQLAAKTSNEAENILNIINTLKYHMHPELTQLNYLILPSEFEIAFYSGSNQNAFLGKISTCALTSVTTNYTPNGVWSSLRDQYSGLPPVITLSLHFIELDILTKDRLEKWGEYQAGMGLENVDGFAGNYSSKNNPSTAKNNKQDPQGESNPLSAIDATNGP